MVEKLKAQNSNQANMETQEAPTKRSPGGILKKRTPSRTQLETVSEYAESQMERKDSSLSTADSEKSVNMQPQEEQEKFKMLCEGVQNTLALFQTSLAELLALKDELLQHALPPSLLVKMTLVTGKLFRSSSDLSVPITELVRMVKLYSAPWEAKSTALKKLHEDYENKQRQLNVALQKLVLVGIQSERMAQERRVMNWEKLFSRTMSSQAHGYRWKFLIESFKKKAKNGDVYMAASTDEEAEKEREKQVKLLEGIKRRSKHKETAAKKIMRESLATTDKTTMPAAVKEPEPDDQVDFEDDLVSDPEDLKLLTFEDVTSSREQSPELTAKRPMSPAFTAKKPVTPSTKKPTSPPTAKQGVRQVPRPRIQFLGASDEEEEEQEEQNTLKATTNQFMPSNVRPKIRFTAAKEEKKKTKRPGVKFLSLSDDEDSDDKDEQREDEKLPLMPSSPQVVKVDRSCWTQEPEYERYLHVRVYRPECKKATTPFCSIAFCGTLLKTAEFEAPEAAPEDNPQTAKAEVQAREGKQRAPSRQTMSGRKATKSGASAVTSSKVPVSSPAPESTDIKEAAPRFEELVFKLPDDSGHVFGQPKIDISKEPLRIAVHPGTNQPMIAMGTVNYEDLKVLEHFEDRRSNTGGSDVMQQHPLTSVSSDRDMPFNSPCGHVPLLCYQSKEERARHLVKETETASFEELLDAEIEARKEAEKAQQVAEEVTKPTPVYTEEDISFLRDQHAQEILSIQEEYEKRLNELAQGLSPFSQEEESGRFVSVATSPIFLRSPSPLRSGSPDHGRAPQPPPVAKSPNRKARPKIPNLPDWGKDLPEDFLVRLAMFADNSVKYHQELGEKTRRAIQQKYELQMAVQNRLNAPTEQQNEEEVCLPAVFMPTRNGHVYSPKAHSYFHPLGSSEGRLTQPPSMFKLPFLPPENQVSVLNLFDVGQKYVSTSSHWTLPEQSRPSNMATPYVSQTAPPPPTACGWRTPSPPFPDRAKTR